MNSTLVEQKINVKSDEYILHLQARPGQFKGLKDTLRSFLESEPQRLLLLEDPDPSDGAWKLFQVLNELPGLPLSRLAKEYLKVQNQTMLRWEDLLETLYSSEAQPKFKKMLVCEFAETFQPNHTDGLMISGIIERVSFSLGRKAIFIVSRKDLLSKYLGNIKCESCLYYNVPEYKIMPVFEANVESLIGRASCGDVCAVKDLLERGVNVNATELNGNTALHEAAAKGHRDVVLTLLRYGANHLLDGNKKTPLHLTAEKGFRDIVLMFLENGVDVNIEGWCKYTALHCAVQNDHVNIVWMLLTNGANHICDESGYTPLHYAARDGHQRMLLILLLGRANVNQQASLLQKTALHLAAQSGHKDIVLTLLENRAKHQADENDETPLHLAAKHGHTEVVSVLIENGVDVNIRGNSGMTPLQCAAEHGHSKVVSLLISKGADNYPAETASDLALARTKNK